MSCQTGGFFQRPLKFGRKQNNKEKSIFEETILGLQKVLISPLSFSKNNFSFL
jgi:hypothetical protein